MLTVPIRLGFMGHLINYSNGMTNLLRKYPPKLWTGVGENAVLTIIVMTVYVVSSGTIYETLICHICMGTIVYMDISFCLFGFFIILQKPIHVGTTDYIKLAELDNKFS